MMNEPTITDNLIASYGITQQQAEQIIKIAEDMADLRRRLDAIEQRHRLEDLDAEERAEWE